MKLGLTAHMKSLRKSIVGKPYIISIYLLIYLERFFMRRSALREYRSAMNFQHLGVIMAFGGKPY